MTFSQLHSSYIELGRQYLDNFPAKSKGDLLVIKGALQAILDPKSNNPVPAKLEERVKAIQELIDSPELYVAKEEDYPKFRALIRSMVLKKIEQLKNLTPKKKKEYLKWQQQRQKHVTQHQKLIAISRPPAPNSPAHTDIISEEEMFMQMELDSLGEEFPRLDSLADRFVFFFVAMDRLNDINPPTEEEQRSRIQFYKRSMLFMLTTGQKVYSLFNSLFR